MSQVFAVFAAVFLAELGDKTQVATLLFATKGEHHPFVVFLAAAVALVAATAMAVALGTLAERYVSALPLKLIAGLGFVVIGLWTIAEHLQQA